MYLNKCKSSDFIEYGIIKMCEKCECNEELHEYHAEIDSNTRNVKVNLEWSNLNVSAIITKSHLFRKSNIINKQIIHNVSGSVRSKSLVAIMGGSGSGKSTLMSALAGRSPAEVRISGVCKINGYQLSVDEIRRISGFVHQDELFIPTLTIWEHLNFIAQLKPNSLNSNAVKRKTFIKELLMQVGLSHCANVFIGSSKFGRKKINLSRGEQKRLSVITELVTDPPLLFCDEPTTGLDSYTSYKLLKIFEKLCIVNDKTIICSIHQPNEQIFSLFHQIILMKDGKIAFNGTPNDATDFFKNIGFFKSDSENKPEFLIRSLTESSNPVELDDGSKCFIDICDVFEESIYAKEIQTYVSRENKAPNPLTIKMIQKSWFELLFLMIYRNILGIFRDPGIQYMMIIQKSILAFNIAICLMGTIKNTQEGIQSLKGAIFLMVAENFFSPTYAAMGKIPEILPLFIREYSNDINTPSLFYFAHLVSLLPGLLIDSTVFTAVLYYIAGLRLETNLFLWTIAINALVLNVSNAFGSFLSVCTNNQGVAQSVVLPLDTICMILGGIFIRLRSVPFFLLWVRYISWMTLASEMLLILQISDNQRIGCSLNSNQPCLQTGTEVLNQLDFDSSNFYIDFITMCFTYFVFHILGFVVFSIKNDKKYK